MTLGLTRLNQYKMLEKRKADEVAAGPDPTEFLRESDIRIYLEFDVEKQIDRAVELINRTNQLNFTKQRLSEDTDLAKGELKGLLARFFSRPHWFALLIGTAITATAAFTCSTAKIDI